MTRSKLLGMQAPLKSRKKCPSGRDGKIRNKRQMAFACYANKRQLAARDMLVGSSKRQCLGSRAEYLARMARLKKDWKDGSCFVQEEDEVPGIALSYADRIGDLLFGTSSAESPMDSEVVKDNSVSSRSFKALRIG